MGKQTFGLWVGTWTLFVLLHPSSSSCCGIIMLVGMQSQTTPPTPKISETYTTVQVYKYKAYEPLILVYSSLCSQWYSWLDSRNQLRTVCFCYTGTIIMTTYIQLLYTVINFEAGKQLVISNINGNDTLGWTDFPC